MEGVCALDKLNPATCARDADEFVNDRQPFVGGDGTDEQTLVGIVDAITGDVDVLKDVALLKTKVGRGQHIFGELGRDIEADDFGLWECLGHFAAPEAGATTNVEDVVDVRWIEGRGIVAVKKRFKDIVLKVETMQFGEVLRQDIGDVV